MFFVSSLVVTGFFIALIFWLDARARRKRVDALLPSLKKIDAAMAAKPHGPIKIAVWRRAGAEVVHLSGHADGVDYRITRIGTIGKPMRFHVELIESALPVIDDLDWNSEAVETLKGIFLKQKLNFEQLSAIGAGIRAAVEREETQKDGLN
jgi:hypothetical protein